MTDTMKKQHGLTLIELMVTLAVAIILITVGMPLFSGVAANNRASVHTNMLVTALNLARSEAVGRSENVSVCASATNPPGGTPTCGTAAQWGNGWFAFTDDGVLGTFDGSDTRLRIWEVSGGNPPSVAVVGGTAAVFNHLGSAGAQITFEMSQSGAPGNPTRCITVSATGQIRTTRAACP